MHVCTEGLHFSAFHCAVTLSKAACSTGVRVGIDCSTRSCSCS